jgi:hypothetical protein
MIHDPLEEQFNAIIILHSLRNFTELDIETAFTADAAMPKIKMNEAKME